MEKQNLAGTRMLKFISIVMIILGIIAAGMAALALLGMSVAGSTIGITLTSEMTEIAYIYIGGACVAGVVMCITGIVGAVNCRNPYQTGTVIVLGILNIIVTLAMSVAVPLYVSSLEISQTSAFIELFGDVGIDLLSSASGLLLPILYLYSAFKNKQSV